MDLFEKSDPGHKEVNSAGSVPLAERMRPQDINHCVGQQHLIGEGKPLRIFIEKDEVPSMIFWGPPGCGKTTLARIISRHTNAEFFQLNAVSSGVQDVRKILDRAHANRTRFQRRTILFIDEIHRFNKSQQDAVLPFVEDGTIILIGATTENPSFEVTSPLLSRSRVIPLKPLSGEELKTIVNRALMDSLHGIGDLKVELDDDAFAHLVSASNNDARVALNTLEIAAQNTPPGPDGKRHVNLAAIEDSLQHRALLYDRAGDQHFDIISALHKSMRGSDPDAALYWLARMLEAGEDPLYIARRLVRFASEDVGMADPQALVIAMAAQQAVHFIGMPEGNLALAEAVVYLATAPKSNSLYTAYTKAQEEVKEGATTSVPLHLRNPVTGVMKDLGYGKDYKYAHNFPDHFVEQQNLPDALKGKKFYTPSEQGYEKTVLGRLKTWWGRKEKPEEKPESKADG